MSAEHPPVDPLVARFLVYAEAGVRRVSFEVGGEQVSLFARHGKLRALCTCGVEGCEHQQLALSFLGLPNADGAPPAAPGVEARVRSSMRPSAPVDVDADALADAFDELFLATARAGVSAPDSPSIREALEQLLAHAPEPPPLALARWVGRLNDALAFGDVGKVARLFDGARAWVDELRTGDRSPAALARRRAWLGPTEGGAPETLSDGVLVEVAREWLHGLTRTAIERRYLVDLDSGELLREERRRADHDISVGPCPRVVQVAFGEIEPALRPRRVRLLQYTVSPEPSQQQWTRIAELAERHVRDLRTRYADDARACPGLAEPFVMFAPAELETGSEAALRDASGDRLPLSDDVDAPLADAVRAVSHGGDIAWVSGRLLGLARGLVLRPTSVLLRRAGKLQLCRIT